MGKIPIIPTGSVEQHGHHLPLKVDHLCANAVATEAARLKPELALVLPPVSYGYVSPRDGTSQVSLNIHYEHFIQYVLDITKSLAYHGFKKMILVNGHGSNHNLVDMVARRTIVETDASCTFCSWWHLLRVHPDFDKEWRESVFPGGCSHACELETSMAAVSRTGERTQRQDQERDRQDEQARLQVLVHRPIFTRADGFDRVDESVFGYRGDGRGGRRATAEKGKIVFEEASRNLAEFVEEYHAMKIEPRTRHQDQEPTFPLSFPTD